MSETHSENFEESNLVTIAFVSRLPAPEIQQWIRVLQALLPEYEIRLFKSLSLQQKQKCSVAIVANPDPAELRQLPNLDWVHSTWAGVERMVSELSVEEAPFAIVRLTDPTLAQTMAEAVLAWTLYLHREMPEYRQQQEKKEWFQRPYISANERTVGILGLGNMGYTSAERLRGNGFNVLGWSRTKKTLQGIPTYTDDSGLQSILAQSDIIVNLLPLTHATRGLFNTSRFTQCKQGAAIINFGRGPSIVDADLIAALDAGILSHAVLDVFAQEPLPENHPYWLHGKISLLPHISAQTNQQTASEIVTNNIREYFKTGCLPKTVDRQLGY